MRDGALRWIMGLSAAACLCLMGCAWEGSDDAEGVGEAEDDIIILNSLDLASVSFGAIQLGPLRFDTLPPEAQVALQDPGELGDEARKTMRYIVGCAYPSGSRFDFSWVDDGGFMHLESYAGQVGLAPGWTSGPATDDDTGWVSACLIARANRYGAVVQISTRGGNGVLATMNAFEFATYTHLEGAFWGDLFAAPPVAYSCTNPPEQPYAVSQLRECASGLPAPPGTEDGCGMTQMVGSCTDLCGTFDPVTGYHADCAAVLGEPETDRVVTVYLK